MKANELFDLIKSTDYTTSGNDVDWAIKVFHDEKRIRLLFEASASKTDWINNFRFPIKPYKQQENILWLQKGWATAWKSCNDEICVAVMNEIEKAPDYELEVCGWSYGGAMALIAAEDLGYRTGRHDLIVSTFGAPKPLFGRKTKEYVLSYIKEINQYSHRNDIVPMMPPLSGYKLGNKVKVEKKKLFGIFQPNIYHCIYGDESLYYSCE